MKFLCPCGAVIVDQTDYLSYKGHLFPDQNWFDTHDAIDSEVIDKLAAGQITREEAHTQVDTVLDRFVRMVYECRDCGRLFIDDRNHELQSYVPESKDAPKELLRNKDSKPNSSAT